MAHVGVVVPPSVKEKIWAGQYIDLTHLLPKGERDEEEKSIRIVGGRVVQKGSLEKLSLGT